MNKITLFKLAISVFLTISLVAFATGNVIEIISVAQLVDNKDKYHEKIVRVKGYASVGFENCILRPEKAEKSSYSFKYRIWFREIEKGCVAGDLRKKSKYGQVIIEGTFSKIDRGHLGSFSGSIDNAKINWLEKDR